MDFKRWFTSGTSNHKSLRLPKERRNTMEDFLKAVANVGFPIAVAAYLLIRIESKMDSLAASINQLSTILSVKLGNDDRKSA
jgi:flagellar biogenesis protein FliO